MGKIISFANQKGGVGKTSLCAIFANHLTAKGQKVSVKDMDIQMSLSGHREDDLKVDPEAKPSWNVEFVNPMDSKEVAAKLQAWKADDSITLIDAPGSLAFPGLVPILKNADVIVIPMTYDHDVLRSTLGFLKACSWLPQAASRQPQADVSVPKSASVTRNAVLVSLISSQQASGRWPFPQVLFLFRS